MSALLDRLRALSAAEEFFELLEVPYDPRLVSVNRLHIMKKFSLGLARLRVDEAPEAEQVDLARQALREAHDLFLSADARAAGLFKLFHPQGGGFVPLVALSRPSSVGTPTECGVSKK